MVVDVPTVMQGRLGLCLIQRFACFDSGYTFTSVYGDIRNSCSSFLREGGHWILRFLFFLVVRLRSAGN